MTRLSWIGRVLSGRAKQSQAKTYLLPLPVNDHIVENSRTVMLANRWARPSQTQ
jgi:hypothetical protein